MKEYLLRLYTYNEWANQTLIANLQQNAPENRELLLWLSHYVSAQEIWISRIQGRKANVDGVWGNFSLEKNLELSAATFADWKTFIENISEDEYTRLIAYKNTRGDYYETPIIDIMCHCVNHATYHRAQIAVKLRAIGKEPVNTDFITYARKFALPQLAV